MLEGSSAGRRCVKARGAPLPARCSGGVFRAGPRDEDPDRASPRARAPEGSRSDERVAVGRDGLADF